MIFADSDQITTTHKIGKENEPSGGSPTVRFASVNEEIEPDKGLETLSNQTQISSDEATLKELSKTLGGTQLQGRRMSCFAFEPVSLPASRVRLHPCYPSTSQHGCPNVPKGRRSDEPVFTITPRWSNASPSRGSIILDFPWDASFSELCALRSSYLDPPPCTN